jgi:DNA-binding FrmR family transcriptional regulator
MRLPTVYQPLKHMVDGRSACPKVSWLLTAVKGFLHVLAWYFLDDFLLEHATLQVPSTHHHVNCHRTEL